MNFYKLTLKQKTSLVHHIINNVSLFNLQNIAVNNKMNTLYLKDYDMPLSADVLVEPHQCRFTLTFNIYGRHPFHLDLTNESIGFVHCNENINLEIQSTLFEYLTLKFL